MNDSTLRTHDELTVDVLETIRQLWVRVGTWPTWSDVDFLIDTRLRIADPWSAVRSIDRRLLWGVGEQEPSDRSEVGLSVAGLALLPGAAEDVRIFIETVQAAVQMVQDRPPSEEGDRLASTDLARLVRLPAAGRDPIVRRQHSIWKTAPGWRSLGGPDPETGVWSITIDRKAIRRFRDVTSVEDYMRAAASADTTASLSPLGPGLEQSNPAPSRPAPEAPHEPADAVTRSPVHRHNDLVPITSASTPPRTEGITTSNGATFTLFLDHVIAQTRASIVYAGHGGDQQSVAIKRVALRTFDTEAWYRDGRAVEREAAAAVALAQVPDAHVLPLLGHALDDSSFTFVYPLAVTTLDHVVDVVATAKGVAGRRPFGAPTDGRSPVHHDPTRAAIDLYGSRGPDEDIVRLIGLELARGLAVMHNRAVLHRDIKPANILRHDGRWCLGDLGIAKLMEDTTSSFTLAGAGTPAYMPPEIFGFRPATQRSDVYSLGCTLYAVLYGRPPWTDGDLSRSHRLEAPDLSAITDDALAVALTAMMHKDEPARPTAEQVVVMLASRPPAVLRGFGTVVRAAARVDEARAIDRAKAENRRAAADIAIERFRLVWRELETMVRGSYPTVVFGQGQDAWLMTAGDWQLTVQIHEPGSSRCAAVQLGTVSLQIADRPDQRTALANLVALWSEDNEVPDWRVYRMAANYASVHKVPVSSSRAHADGALIPQHLEEHLAERGTPGATAAMVTADLDLTAQALLDLFTDEVAAIVGDDASDG